MSGAATHSAARRGVPACSVRRGWRLPSPPIGSAEPAAQRSGYSSTAPSPARLSPLQQEVAPACISWRTASISLSVRPTASPIRCSHLRQLSTVRPKRCSATYVRRRLRCGTSGGCCNTAARATAYNGRCYEVQRTRVAVATVQQPTYTCRATSTCRTGANQLLQTYALKYRQSPRSVRVVLNARPYSEYSHSQPLLHGLTSGASARSARPRPARRRRSPCCGATACGRARFASRRAHRRGRLRSLAAAAGHVNSNTNTNKQTNKQTPDRFRRASIAALLKY